MFEGDLFKSFVELWTFWVRTPGDPRFLCDGWGS